MSASSPKGVHKVVTLVSKRGCHLCERVLEALRTLSSHHDFEVRVVYIDDDEKLHDRYWLSVPVVQVDGKDVFDANDMAHGEDYSGKLESRLG